jgi:hypothetical protein
VANEVVVRGFKELQRAFALADPALKKRFREELREAGDPVRSSAEELARSDIRNMTDRWARMRVGVTTSTVYVAPSSRRSAGGKRRRRNLYDLILGRSLEPALERQEPQTISGVERMLDGLATDWERV